VDVDEVGLLGGRDMERENKYGAAMARCVPPKPMYSKGGSTIRLAMLSSRGRRPASKSNHRPTSSGGGDAQYVDIPDSRDDLLTR